MVLASAELFATDGELPACYLASNPELRKWISRC